MLQTKLVKENERKTLWD